VLISDAAKYIQGTFDGNDVEFRAVSTDTRTIKAGDLFVALRGPFFDGHEYLEIAENKGAAAILVSKTVSTQLPTIRVKDTLEGLGLLAAAWKRQCDIKTIAVTGSCGKTSVKEMLYAILDDNGDTLATKGNFNNEIGVPLTLLELNKQYKKAVVELGANHLGEIAYTTALVKPNVALITNVGAAHIEGFGSQENIAKAKAEIFYGLVEGGVAIMNRDDDFFPYWWENTSPYQQRTFSLENASADFYASDICVNSTGRCEFMLHGFGDVINVSLPLLGRHNVINAVASAAAAEALGFSLQKIKNGLEKVKPIPGRLFPEVFKENYLIDDSYNANPVSIKAAIDLLKEMGRGSCLVLGDMGELGIHSPSLHADVGAYAAKQGVDFLIVKGKYASDYLVGYVTNKQTFQQGMICDSDASVTQYILDNVNNATILVKGSRSAKMEKTVQLLRESVNSEELG